MCREGSWVYGRMGLLDGLPATNRKEAELRGAGWDESLVAEVARVMEYSAAYALYRADVEQRVGTAA